MNTSDPLSEFEAAEDIIAAGGGDDDLKVSAVLALARGGATDMALDLFAEYRLARLTENEDALALRGRLLKDRAAALSPSERPDALLKSAEAYNSAWELTGGTYSGINAATLYMLAGQRQRGAALARKILSIAQTSPDVESSEQHYYRLATCAEALLLLDRQKDSELALKRATAADPDNYVAHATTLRQFLRIANEFDQSPDWLNAFRPPRTCFFAGRMHGLVSGSSRAAALGHRINDYLSETDIGPAFGALAAGSDIIFAEAHLCRGGSLHAVLPCPIDTFEAHSVAPFGADWVRRYRQCLSQATSVTEATRDETLMGELTIEFGARLAMGLAISRADELATRPIQVLIQPRKGGLSDHFARIWRANRRDLSSKTISIPESFDETQLAAPGVSGVAQSRQLAAILFADLTGFGRLSDRDVMRVLEKILLPLSNILRARKHQIAHLNSWGDGIFAVFDSVPEAARTALDLQAFMRDNNPSKHGLPSSLALRIGAHYGPVTYANDPVTGRKGVFGSQVSYAARIEPLAVPGAILTSEAFAAALALAGGVNARSRYIGRQILKGTGTPVRLFSLSGSFLPNVLGPAPASSRAVAPTASSAPDD